MKEVLVKDTLLSHIKNALGAQPDFIGSLYNAKEKTKIAKSIKESLQNDLAAVKTVSDIFGSTILKRFAKYKAKHGSRDHPLVASAVSTNRAIQAVVTDYRSKDFVSVTADKRGFRAFPLIPIASTSKTSAMTVDTRGMYKLFQAHKAKLRGKKTAPSLPDQGDVWEEAFYIRTDGISVTWTIDRPPSKSTFRPSDELDLEGAVVSKNLMQANALRKCLPLSEFDRLRQETPEVLHYVDPGVANIATAICEKDASHDREKARIRKEPQVSLKTSRTQNEEDDGMDIDEDSVHAPKKKQEKKKRPRRAGNSDKKQKRLEHTKEAREKPELK
ncbi:hypothetical protein HK101_006036, partial [Irineochytrium annulatum]